MNAPAPHQTWPEAWLSHQSQTGRQVWAVVDASADAAQPHVRRLDASSTCTNLMSHITSDPAALALAPRVTPIESDGHQLALRTMWQTQTADEPMLFLIASDWPQAMWTQSMRRRMRARFTDGERMLMRWWDARIWWALHDPTISAHGDVQAFLAIEAASIWPGRDGRLHTSENRPCDEDPLRDETAWPVSDPTFSGLLQLGHADAVLGICRSDHAAALALVPPAERHALACAQIAWAQAQGWHSAGDHAIAFCIAAEVGADWAEQAEWAELVAKATASGQTLRTTLAES